MRECLSWLYKGPHTYICMRRESREKHVQKYHAHIQVCREKVKASATRHLYITSIQYHVIAFQLPVGVTIRYACRQRQDCKTPRCLMSHVILIPTNKIMLSMRRVLQCYISFFMMPLFAAACTCRDFNRAGQVKRPHKSKLGCGYIM
jgi:hypothetical protein